MRRAVQCLVFKSTAMSKRARRKLDVPFNQPTFAYDPIDAHLVLLH